MWSVGGYSFARGRGDASPDTTQQIRFFVWTDKFLREQIIKSKKGFCSGQQQQTDELIKRETDGQPDRDGQVDKERKNMTLSFIKSPKFQLVSILRQGATTLNLTTLCWTAVRVIIGTLANATHNDANAQQYVMRSCRIFYCYAERG